MRIKAVQRTSNSWVQLTLVAVWRHASVAGSDPVSAVAGAERRSVGAYESWAPDAERPRCCTPPSNRTWEGHDVHVHSSDLADSP